MILRKILTANTQLILGCAKYEKIGIAINSCTLGVIELEYTEFVPHDRQCGCMFQFVASIETKVENV